MMPLAKICKESDDSIFSKLKHLETSVLKYIKTVPLPSY